MKNKLEKYLDIDFDSFAPGEERELPRKYFSDFSRDFKKHIKNDLPKDYELAEYNKGYFYISGFVKNITNNKFVYFSVPDVRYDKNGWNDNILYRTAQHEKDYTGGSNQYCKLEELSKNIQNTMPIEKTQDHDYGLDEVA